jgi:hypothetical protein
MATTTKDTAHTTQHAADQHGQGQQPQDQHAAAPGAQPADHPAAPPTTPPPAPAKPAYQVPKALAGGKAKLEVEIAHTAGGDVKFIVVTVTNALSPEPGDTLTLDQIEAIGAAGWEVTAVAKAKVV